MNFNKPYSEMTPEEQEKFRKTLETEVERKEMLKRLFENEDFKKFFLEFYCKEEAQRLVLLMGDKEMSKNETSRIDISERMIGIARFNAFMNEQAAMSFNAEKLLYAIDHPEMYEENIVDSSNDELEG